MKPGSGCNFIERAASISRCSKSISRFLGTSNAGNKSPIKPMNTGLSSVTILGMLKSRSALISTWSSGRKRSPRCKILYQF